MKVRNLDFLLVVLEVLRDDLELEFAFVMTVQDVGLEFGVVATELYNNWNLSKP